ncbi:hypothetical protein [Bradyrhizobium diazoefficiens]|uniref:hypothetical protein n=1 Tax=Bradyrhizobium diazoefficiens TaxID=1355477 RepID=UPI00272D03CB|nr:hypothetical protein [Bradyrhizobium diazoefficiens]WLA69205.1 hypothetical protein QNN01_22705 [Bradyrhizobium diazoefficiens]
MSMQSVKFRDGMVITADDLDTAMRYPLGVIQTLVRAYFGCGIVCGLEVRDPGAQDYQEVPDCPRLPAPNFTVCIEPGVALGCDGYPIELCAPIKLDLTPDPCCDPRPEKVCIAIRRRTSDDAPRQDCGGQGNCGCGQNKSCGCGQTGHTPSCQCTRIRDHVEVRVFNAPGPKGLCALPEQKTSPRQDGVPGAAAREREFKVGLCDCLKACSDCDACGESWILLGEVTIPKKAVGNETQLGISLVPESRRQYVKPTQCACNETARLNEEAKHQKEDDDERLKAYQKREADIETRLKALEAKVK